MGLEPPVLEYARVERIGGDRYRLSFFLAGVPGTVALFTPIGRFGSLCGDTVSALRGTHKAGFSTASILAIALAMSILLPVTAAFWRWLRLDGGMLGPHLQLAGLILAGIHVAGVLGMAYGFIAVDHGDAVMGSIGLAVSAICGWFVVRAYGRLGWAEWILVVLLNCEIAFYPMFSAGMWRLVGSVSIWQVITGGTVLVRGVEFVHVLRRGRSGDGE